MEDKIQCREIEELMYLKRDELSNRESETLDAHLISCERCRKEYNKVWEFVNKIDFESTSIASSFLEARVIDNYIKHQDKISEKPRLIRRQILKALSIASVFFFVLFSVEQVNTVRKISNLEQKLAGKGETNVRPQKQVLVLNHFYDLDDLKQIMNPDVYLQAGMGSIFNKTNSEGLDLKLFNAGGKLLIKEIYKSGVLGKSLLDREFYGNSRLLNLTKD